MTCSQREEAPTASAHKASKPNAGELKTAPLHRDMKTIVSAVAGENREVVF